VPDPQSKRVEESEAQGIWVKPNTKKPLVHVCYNILMLGFTVFISNPNIRRIYEQN